MKEHVKTIFCSYSDIFFLNGGILGALLFAVTLVNPNVAVSGIISVLAAYCFARFIHMDREFLESGFYTYNPLLVGLSIGYLFKLAPLTAFFIVSAGVLTFMLTIVMANVFLTYLKLPILSLPFVIVSSIAYLASLRYSNLLVAPPRGLSILTSDLGLPLWVAGFFKSFGTILFSPSVLVGFLFSLLVLCSSRILFLLAVVGYYVGAFARTLMLGSVPQAFGDINSFNFILIAMAVGGVYLIPSVSSYLMAIIAVVVSTVFLDSISVFWSNYGIPAFTLPFNMISLCVIYVLGLMSYPMIASAIGRTPEDTLENHLANRLRYRGGKRTLYLPFSGTWTVWQGFDGQWTHKGSWRYAYDFVITDGEEKTHRGDGEELEEYYCYRKPVLSPVRGRVVKVINDLPDSPIGSVDRTNNWGNLIILHDDRGFYVEISHLAEKSAQVKEGDWVERGGVLGLCGNSGYSPQPHIHIQVQANDDIGAGSMPFSIVGYSDGLRYHANDLPEEKSNIEPLFPDKRLDNVTNFVLDDIQEYQVARDGVELGRLRLKVKMALDGTFYLDSERGKLYFGKHEGTFYFYRIDGQDEWLRQLFLALPRMPLAYRKGLEWQDFVPIGLATPFLQRTIFRFLSSFHPGLAKVQATQTFLGRDRVDTVIESKLLGVKKRAEVELDAKTGFASVKIGNLELRRISNEGA